MTFSEIPAGAAVFLDANSFVYHFTAHESFGEATARLMDRIDRQELSAFTSVHVLAEVSHRLMTIEAVQTFGWQFAGIAARLRSHPDVFPGLTQHQRAVDEVLASRIAVLPVTADMLSQATAIMRQTGLLTNDALLVAIMKQHGLIHLASHDRDFERVPGIIRYGPV